MKINVILSLFLIITISSNGFSQCQEDDYIALRALYLSTDGDNWGSANNTDAWPNAAFFLANPTMPAGTDVSEWYEVTIDGNGCVTALDLPFNQLTGTLPPELSNLGSLIRLTLTFNNLSGTIPPELGSLTNLIVLDLDINELSGTIPAELGDLVNLVKLTLSYNELSGCYDSNLTNLCTQLGADSNTNGKISLGNNFDAPWQDFCATGAGACVSTCPSDIIVNDIPIPDNLYQAEQTITSSGQVASGTDVVFQAGQCITLDNDFTVEPGGSLTIEIQDCQ